MSNASHLLIYGFGLGPTFIMEPCMPPVPFVIMPALPFVIMPAEFIVACIRSKCALNAAFDDSNSLI
jgi:hypothetical protein